MYERRKIIYILARFFLIIDHNTVDLSTATQKEWDHSSLDTHEELKGKHS